MSDKGELPFKKVTEVVNPDGSSTWVTVNPMDKFKKVSFDDEKNDIAKGLRDVLVRIPENVPEQFKDGAIKVAGWMTELDKGNKGLLTNPEVGEWVGELYGGSGLMELNNSPPPKEGWMPLVTAVKTPWWLGDVSGELAERVFKCEKLDDEEEKRMETLYLEWGRKLGLDEMYESNWGRFFDIREIDNRGSDADGFKIYFGGKEALNAFEGGQFTRAFEGTEKKNLPENIKLIAGSLIMYYRERGIDPDKIVGDWYGAGIQVASWAQDVYEVDKSGDIRFVTSNDSSFRYFGTDWYVYDQTELFGRYINFCLATGKKPERPFSTSFVYQRGVVPSREIILLPVVKSEERLNLK